jgi:hypothetical protein
MRQAWLRSALGRVNFNELPDGLRDFLRMLEQQHVAPALYLPNVSVVGRWTAP